MRPRLVRDVGDELWGDDAEKVGEDRVGVVLHLRRDVAAVVHREANHSQHHRSVELSAQFTRVRFAHLVHVVVVEAAVGQGRVPLTPIVVRDPRTSEEHRVAHHAEHLERQNVVALARVHFMLRPRELVAVPERRRELLGPAALVHHVPSAVRREVPGLHGMRPGVYGAVDSHAFAPVVAVQHVGVAHVRDPRRVVGRIQKLANQGVAQRDRGGVVSLAPADGFVRRRARRDIEEARRDDEVPRDENRGRSHAPHRRERPPRCEAELFKSRGKKVDFLIAIRRSSRDVSSVSSFRRVDATVHGRVVATLGSFDR